MEEDQRHYMAIDLKSFYASVECVDRKMDPLSTYLVVADTSRTDKTICLAVTPALKALGVKGRPRLFEVEQQVSYINSLRKINQGWGGKAVNEKQLLQHPDWELSYLVATPRMARYMEISNRIYSIYLRFIAPEDIHVYSIDEVFIDLAPYSKLYKKTPKELAGIILKQVLQETGITATVGIGSNLYLAKIAMDMVAKKMPGDENGLRIAELDLLSYRRQLWEHRPITDFWRIGSGYANRLAQKGIYTMGDVARCSLGGKDTYYNQEMLFKLFGINAELLIDHAWGWEPCTLKDIKDYVPENNSVSMGQVLPEPYFFARGRLIALEMGESLSLELVARGVRTRQLGLMVSYDGASLKEILEKDALGYNGRVTNDHYGRQKPYHAQGTKNLSVYTCSSQLIRQCLGELFDGLVDRELLIRKINIVALAVRRDVTSGVGEWYEEQNLFETAEEQLFREKRIKEKKLQRTLLEIGATYGKNAILRGMNLLEGARTMERNQQIGGHKA